MTDDASVSAEFLDAQDPERLRDGIRRAVDYRGDVTVRCTDGSTVTGYAFDARLRPPGSGSLGAAEELRVLASDTNERRRIPLGTISALGFTGKDAASGRSWENWVRRYAEKKLAGEAASIESEAL